MEKKEETQPGTIPRRSFLSATREFSYLPRALNSQFFRVPRPSLLPCDHRYYTHFTQRASKTPATTKAPLATSTPVVTKTLLPLASKTPLATSTPLTTKAPLATKTSLTSKTPFKRPSSPRGLGWVGVHGDQPAEGAPSQPLLPSPGTPHIVVSPEDTNGRNATQGENETSLGAPGPNGPVFPNAQSTPAPPPTPANNTEENRSPRPDKLALNMTTLNLPDGRHPSLDGTFYKKTRRNSISEMHQRFGSTTNLQRSNSTTNIQRSNSRNSLAPSVLDWKQEGKDNLIACLSALYGKLLVVMGMAFPTAEVISHDIPVTFYNGFYLYLYCGSIIFLIYAYLFLLHSINIPTETLKSKFHSIRSLLVIPDISMVLPHRKASKQEGKGS